MCTYPLQENDHLLGCNSKRLHLEGKKSEEKKKRKKLKINNNKKKHTKKKRKKERKKKEKKEKKEKANIKCKKRYSDLDVRE